MGEWAVDPSRPCRECSEAHGFAEAPVNTSVDYATDLLHNAVGDKPGAKEVANKTGLSFEPGRGGHLTVRLGDKITDLPMHGKKKDLPTGTVNAIKKALGLK